MIFTLRVSLFMFIVCYALNLSQARAQVSIDPGGTNVLRLLNVTTKASGGFQCATNDGTPITHQESNPGDPPPAEGDPPIVTGGYAVVKGGTITVTARFMIPSDFNGTVTFDNVTYRGETISGSMNPATVTINTPQSEPFSFNIIIGPVPNYVTLGNLNINLKTTEIDPITNQPRIGSAVTTFRLYTIFSSPLSPQVIPREGVLEDACYWAREQNSLPGVQNKLTYGLFWSQGSPRDLYYTGDENLPAHFWEPGQGFKLTDYLQSSGSTEVNCSDVSNYLTISARAVGVALQSIQFRHDPLQTFITNPICPIGWAAELLSWYSPKEWTMHQVSTIDGRVYDACAAQWQTPSGGVWRNPPWDWLLQEYWQINPVGTVLQSLVFYPGYNLTTAPTFTYIPPIANN